MSFTNIGELDDYIKSFLSPGDLIKFESVSRSKTTPNQWEKLGYEDKNEFKQIVSEILDICQNKDEKKITKDLVLTGRINGQQAKEILKQGYYGKQWCCDVYGIQAIALAIFSPSEIGAMESIKRQWCLSKYGLKLIKQGILTPDEIGNMDNYIRQRVVSKNGTTMLLGGHITKEEMLRMTLGQLDKILWQFSRKPDYLRSTGVSEDISILH